jgi:uncharacterized protein involved in exopolysaccharide biosynthesis
MKIAELSNASLKDITIVFKSNKKQISLLFIALYFVLIIYMLVAPFNYVADYSIMPPKQQSSPMNISAMMQSVGMGGMTGLGGLQQSNLSLFYSEALRSRSVASFIVDSLKLQKTSFFHNIPRHRLIDKISLSLKPLVDRSGIIYTTVSLWTSYFPSKSQKDSAALLSKEIANYSILALDYILRQRSNNVSGKTKDFISGEILVYSNKLDSIQELIEKFQTNNKVLELEEQTKAIVGQANEIAVELAKAEVEMKIANNLYSDNSQTSNLLKQNYSVLKNQFDKIQTGGLTANDKFSIPLNEIPSLIRQYTNLIREQKLYEQILAYLKTNYFQEAIQEKKDVPQIDVLDWAEKPYKKRFPSYFLIFSVGSIVIFIVILVYILLKAFVKK